MPDDPGRTIRPSRPEGTDADFAVDHRHRLRWTTDVFDPSNPILHEVVAAAGEGPGRAILFVDEGVARAWPDLADHVARYAHAHAREIEIIGGVRIVAGGERAKNDWAVYRTVAEAISDAAICRHSYVIALGGGAMLDAVGFAAATAHRGVRLVRLPTTTLAQGDAAIGVKNGINAFGKKNFLGAFSVPWAVINDDRFLETLTDADWRAGFSESVKVALLKDPDLYARLVRDGRRLAARDHAVAAPVIRRTAELHLEHIAYGGDPFELRAARPLDFGHWAAHKLEEMTDYRLRHGEAVAIGIALDVTYANLLGMLADDDTESILGCLTALGFDLYDDGLESPALLGGLDEFREHLGGELTITLLEAIGAPVDVHEMDRDRVRQAVGVLRDRRSRVRSH